MQAVRGVIFASGLQREVFTAGNDIKELYAPQTSIARHVHPFLFACAPIVACSALQQQLQHLRYSLTGLGICSSHDEAPGENVVQSC